MKKLHLIAILFTTLAFTACKKQSLQSYLVESQNKKEFITVDVPSSILQLSMENASDADKQAYESIRKINFVALPYDKAKEGEYETEKNKLKEILSNSSYKKLMNFKDKGKHATIYYLGEADAIDEIIAFGYGEGAGVGVARLLGDNMNPNAIMKMMKNVKVDGDNINLKEFKMIFDKAEETSAE
ncbi:DUF4252 domain-containing protein [Tenacibaculum sp. IB213877]|uniref:DUF4252 domain-containing protein n=1 Tax=Tenacibaculum sp. IB213877 TaxID=3097351 RepID=UPI002A5A5C79|nr:DUF4252 domain-containing protein [Tenacibaculum sp. IB213877]MDY0779669.1 DUF4252 domain-containing protein [Tenacibaculum sp. IB213877]